jgi:DNA-binding transcriptional ArsR family regulator
MTRRSKPPVAIYSALGDTTRCRIIEILMSGPIPVHALADSFAISRPAISRHLRVLKTAGLVAEVKKGRENLYTLRRGKFTKAAEWIAALNDPAAMAQDAQDAQDAMTDDVEITDAADAPVAPVSAPLEQAPVVVETAVPVSQPIVQPEPEVIEESQRAPEPVEAEASIAPVEAPASEPPVAVEQTAPEPIVVVAADTTEKAPRKRAKKPEPATEMPDPASQMGFDF